MLSFGFWYLDEQEKAQKNGYGTQFHWNASQGLNIRAAHIYEDYKKWSNHLILHTKGETQRLSERFSFWPTDWLCLGGALEVDTSKWDKKIGLGSLFKGGIHIGLSFD